MKRILTTLITITAFTVYTSAQVGTGLDFKFKQQAVFPKKNMSALGFSGKLGTSYSLKNYTPYSKNQGQYGTCVSWAMSYAAMSTMYAMNMGFTNRNIITAMAFCPYFTHNNSKVVTDGCVEGNWFYEVGNVLTETGVKKFYLPSIGCATPNDNAMLQVAKNYRVSQISDLYVYTDLVSEDYKTFMQKFMKKDPFKVNDVKTALASNLPVVIGMYLPSSFMKVNTGFWEPDAAEKADPVQSLLDSQGEMHASHAMTIIGYDDTKYGGAFEVMNSWGPGWGDKGYVWVRYADLQRYVFECLTIEMPTLSTKATTACIYGDCDGGYGIYKYNNGDMYEGFFKNGKKNGYGIYAWANGAVYAGEWSDDLRSGDALYYYTDGTYGGTKYANDKFQSGFARYTWDSGDKFEGNVKNGEFEGFGKYTFANGSSFEGTFSNGTYNGLGKYVFVDGGYHIGYFADGQRNGKGIYISPSGKIWGGEWSYDNFTSGKTYGFANGKNFEFDQSVTANNSYLDANCTSGDCLNGKGTRKYTNGNVYEGSFKDGVENGIGKITYSNGTIAEAFYANGNIIGAISCKYSDGGIQIGYYNGTGWDGYVVYFDASGSVMIGQYKNGTMIGKVATANNNPYAPVKMSSPPQAAFIDLPVMSAGK